MTYMSKKMERPSESLTAFERYQELNMNQVAKLIGVTSRQSVWRYIKEGKLPEPRYLAPKRPVWRLGEVLDHTHNQLKSFEEVTHPFKHSTKPKDAKAQNVINRLKDRLGLH